MAGRVYYELFLTRTLQNRSIQHRSILTISSARPAYPQLTSSYTYLLHTQSPINLLTRLFCRQMEGDLDELVGFLENVAQSAQVRSPNAAYPNIMHCLTPRDMSRSGEVKERREV
jgi:hypothetical protein